MKTHLKSIAWLLITLTLFQSCITSKTTISKAIENEHRVKIKTAGGKTYAFNRLLLKDSVLYGERRVNKMMVTQDLSNLTIVKVRDPSPALTIVVGFISFIAVLYMIECVTCDGWCVC